MIMTVSSDCTNNGEWWRQRMKNDDDGEWWQVIIELGLWMEAENIIMITNTMES